VAKCPVAAAAALVVGIHRRCSRRVAGDYLADMEEHVCAQLNFIRNLVQCKRDETYLVKEQAAHDTAGCQALGIERADENQAAVEVVE
jgi:hypothetical protein